MASYFQSVLPEPFRIFGLRLKPLSLGRYRLLQRFNCAFVSEGEAIARPGDLFLGVFICSQTCQDFLTLLESGEFVRTMEKWGSKIFSTTPWGKFLPRKLQRPKPFDYLEKVALFKRYLSESISIPAYWETNQGQDATISAAHWTQGVEVVLRGELNWTGQEIEESSLSKAISDYYKWLENKGAIQIIDAEEAKQIKEDADHNTAILSQLLGIKDGA